MNVKGPGQLADVVAQIITLSTAVRQELLETQDITQRLRQISTLLARELDVLELEDQIHTSVQKEVDKTQREYFLRERLRAIQQELGEIDGFTRDMAALRRRLEDGEYPDHVTKRAEEELRRLSMMPSMAPEVGILRTYLEWLLELPWSKATQDNLDIAHAEKVLESQHFGLPKAKQRILEYIAVRKMAQARRQSTILCFVGPPGTGKTSLGRSIAEALGREFVRVSLGGVRDEAEVRGHRRTYVGALPGRILQTMRRAGTTNPVFMLDEVDKIGTDFRGDPSSALLEVLDPEQNWAFSDHYLEIAYDLSQVLFIATANVLGTIPPALQDRMEVIEFPGYTELEKMEIVRRYLIPRQIEQNGLGVAPPVFPPATLRRLIRQYTYEAGVRNLEREIGSICRKATMRLASGKASLAHRHRAVAAALSRPAPLPAGTCRNRERGGWPEHGTHRTPNGGDLLPVEVTLTPGKGNLTLTGATGWGDAGIGSRRTHLLALPGHCLESLARGFREVRHPHPLPGRKHCQGWPERRDHHCPALVSAFTGHPVSHAVAMTGEITLRGRVLAVGRLKEKLLAAHRAGVRTVILPARNRKDIQDVPKEIRRQLCLVYVETMDEVLAGALIRPH